MTSLNAEMTKSTTDSHELSIDELDSASGGFLWIGVVVGAFAAGTAIRMGIEKGHVVARLNIDEKGNVTSVTIVSADPPRHFDRAVIDALSNWKFAADGEKYVGEIEVDFKLQ